MHILSYVMCILCLLVSIAVFQVLQTTRNMNVSAYQCTQKKPFADQIITLLVGPEDLGMSAVDCDYARYSGKVTSVNMYLMSLLSDRDGVVPTEDIDQTITIRMNGKPVIENMLVTILPSHTNIDLGEMCERIDNIESRDTISVEVSNKDNAFRSVTIGFGISAHD
jgi:hypothetical protein